MNTRGMDARMLEVGMVEEEVPRQVQQDEKIPQGSQGDQLLIAGQGNMLPFVPLKMTNGDIREGFITSA